MRRLSIAWALAGVVALGLGAGAAGAADGDRVDLQVTVIHLSSKPGGVDPRARQVDEALRKRFRYESLKVLEQRRLTLALNQLGTLELPNGRRLQVRPLNRDERGVLVAVSVEQQVDLDLRVPHGHPVVVNAGSYEDGDLVLSLESR